MRRVRLTPDSGPGLAPGETPDGALVREIAEELGVEIRVTSWLDGRSPIGDRHVLSVAMAEIVVGDPVPTEHDQLRWLPAGRLDDVDWLEPDRPFLADLRVVLGG